MKNQETKSKKTRSKKPMKLDSELPLPLYSVLINKAISNEEVDTRMAVVEAISSLEISFAAALKKHFAALFKCQSEKKQDKFDALLEYIFYKPSFEDYKQLSRFMLRNKIDRKDLSKLDKALKIRNEVVHNGKVPSDKEVKDVLAIACILSLHLFSEQWPTLKEQTKGVCPFVTITENFWKFRKSTQQKNPAVAK